MEREEVLRKYVKTESTITKVKCTDCEKDISKNNIARHRRVCKGKVPDTSQSDKTILIEELRDEVRSLRVDIANILCEQRVVNNITNNVINLQVNNFGNEDMSHLSHDLLSHCLLNPSKGLPKLIDNIHYNPNVPCNHNIRYKSTKNNSFEKYVNEHWMECDASNTLDELIRKGYRVLNAHYMEHYMNHPDIQENELKQRALERFRFLNDKTCSEYHSIKRDLRLLVKDRTMYVIGLPFEASEDLMVQ
jgi:hypothetical protein